MAKNPPKPKKKPTIAERFPPRRKPSRSKKKSSKVISVPYSRDPTSKDYLFDPGDTGPEGRPRWVRDRMYGMADTELRADYDPLLTSSLMKAGIKKVGPEGLAALLSIKDLPIRGAAIEGGLQNLEGLGKNQSPRDMAEGREILGLVNEALRREGVVLHEYPHWRDKYPEIFFPAIPDKKDAEDLMRITSTDPVSEDLVAKYNAPENLRKVGLSVIPHELLHTLQEPVANFHPLIYYLMGLGRKKLKDTPHEVTESEWALEREERAMKVPFESEIKAEEKRVESGGVPNLLQLLDKYLQKETDIALGKIKVPKKRNRRLSNDQL